MPQDRLPKAERKTLAEVLKQDWTGAKLQRLGIPGLEDAVEDHVLLVLNDTRLHQLHCRDYTTAGKVRHFHDLNSAVEYNTTVARQAAVIVMNYSIHGKDVEFGAVQSFIQVWHKPMPVPLPLPATSPCRAS